MRFVRCRIMVVSVLCILISPFAIAEEILVAKVYRDYPGYIESPTCRNPRLTPESVKQLAVKEQTSEMLSVEESAPSQRARKVYRNYPGYMGPADDNDQLPGVLPEEQVAGGITVEDAETAQVREERISAETIAQEKLAAEQEAVRKLEEARIEAEQAEAERVQAQRLADLKAVMESLANEETNKLLSGLGEAKPAPVAVDAEIAPVAQQTEVKPQDEVSTVRQAEVLPAEENSAPATELNHIDVAKGQVVFEANGVIEKFKYFSLANPPRLVVDLYGLKHSLDTDALVIDEDDFSKVRIGQHDDKTRVVLDASGPVLPEAHVDKHSSEVVVSWGPQDSVITDNKTVEQPAMAEVTADVAEAQHLAMQQAEAERAAAQAAAELLAVKQVEEERIAAQQAETVRLEAERQAKLAAEKIEAEHLEGLRLAKQAEAERIAAQKSEAVRLAAEKLAAERSEAERLEAMMIATAKKAEADRIAAQKAEAERLAAEKVAAERLAAQKAEAERLAAEKLAAAKLAARQAEVERIAAEQVAAEKLAAEKLAASRAAEVKTASVQQALQDAATNKYVVADDDTATMMAANMVSSGSTESSSMSHAKVSPVYGGMWGGFLMPVSADVDNASFTADVDYDNGYAIGLLAGYDFGDWRLDIEGSYRTAGVDKISADGVTATTSGGDLAVTSLMINGYYDFATSGDLSPYIGAGIGAAEVSLDGVRADGDLVADDSDTVLVGQVSAGVLYELNDKVALDLGYRYMMTGNAEFDSPVGKLETDADNHMILVGVKFHF